ncbi:hypothetical protein NIA71_08200 [Ihubacter massiliensis]|uniref:hypothetical protein n=1 Tax=Ihubacter massiliensis TaxID=1852367 RepID=UPI002097EC75|nr:hypothetical protein [Ihubacter massiliensis]MCO7121931.1 hypothetical protein [Ihubacter massiliensis]
MKYRKKPVEVEAFRWTGGIDQTEDPEWIVEAIKDGRVVITSDNYNTPYMVIQTLKGSHIAQPGDYIIKGVAGELYPCKPAIFEQTYEVAK